MSSCMMCGDTEKNDEYDCSVCQDTEQVWEVSEKVEPDLNTCVCSNWCLLMLWNLILK